MQVSIKSLFEFTVLPGDKRRVVGNGMVYLQDDHPKGRGHHRAVESKESCTAGELWRLQEGGNM